MVLSPLLTSSFFLSPLLLLNLPVDFHVLSPEGEVKTETVQGQFFHKTPQKNTFCWELSGTPWISKLISN